jgi:DNA-binding MarR family transcriptional regulator
MREMAAMLHVAPSTVSRALVKLAAWGLIAYVSMRGRYAATVIVLRSVGDGRDRFRQAAKARVRRWSEAANRRVSRLWANVAPYILDGEGGSGNEYRDHYYQGITKGATLTAQPFSAEDVAGIV